MTVFVSRGSHIILIPELVLSGFPNPALMILNTLIGIDFTKGNPLQWNWKSVMVRKEFPLSLIKYKAVRI